MRCSFLLITTTAVIVSAAKRLCLYDVPHSRQQRNALIQPTIEELLHELISSDSSHFRHAPAEELKDRANWLIRIFEIGMAEKKRTLLKKQEMLRFFRETAHVFSPHTNIVQFANDVVPTMEHVAKRIKEFGYQPLEVLRESYNMAFTQEYLENDKETQLAMVREAVKPAVLPPTPPTTTTTTTTTTTSRPPRAHPPLLPPWESSEESEEDPEDDEEFKIEPGVIDDGPAALIYTQAPPKFRQSLAPVKSRQKDHLRLYGCGGSDYRVPDFPQCLELERCNGQGECQSRIDGLYMTEEEICACFEGFTGSTCSDPVVIEEPKHFELSSSPGRSLAVFLLIHLGILLL